MRSYLMGLAVIMALGTVGIAQIPPATAPSNLSVDLADPATLGPIVPFARQGDTQLMMIDLVDLDVPGTRAGEANPPVRLRGEPLRRDFGPEFVGIAASVWRTLAGHRAPPASSMSGAHGVWLDPLGWPGGGVIQGVTRASRVHAYLTSLGTSTGEAFDMVIVNDGTAPVHLGGDGVVISPIKKGEEKSLRAAMQKAAATRGPSVATSHANAYCLEFKLKPPDQGMMFSVADRDAQQKYAPAREILRASRRLQAANQLAPDSEPREYFHSIKQWAIWVSEQRFTQPQYRDAFIERTKKNVTALGRKWETAYEEALKAAVPHRWEEIVKILRAAGQPVPGA